MVSVHKHPVPRRNYDDKNDFTAEQRQRFTEISNAAVKRREKRAKERARKRQLISLKRAVSLSYNTKKKIYAIIMVIVLIVSVILMYLHE